MTQHCHGTDVQGARQQVVERCTHPPVFVDTRPAAGNPQSKLLSAFRSDTHANKVYLAGKEYLGEEGHVFVQPFVGKIKKRISADPTLCPDYPSPFGLAEFIKRATAAALGKNSPAILQNRVFGVQTIGFTGAVRLGAELLRHWYEAPVSWPGPVYLSSPCDDSLAGIFQAAGFPDIRRYHYWDAEQRGVRVEKLLEELERAPESSVVVLSASAHIPTGADLSRENWALITQLMTRRRLFPFILLPAQGLGRGELERDAWPVQLCESLGMELLCAQSFSHCFGLYDECVGHLLSVLRRSSALFAVRSRTEELVRSLWAEPPAGGARLVAAVLGNPAHLVEWQEGVRHMVERCMLIREKLREKLRILGCPGSWDHLTQQTGLYCCTGLNVKQVEFLPKRRHIYLLPDGCLNVSAINSGNLDHIAESIYEALTTPL